LELEAKRSQQPAENAPLLLSMFAADLAHRSKIGTWEKSAATMIRALELYEHVWQLMLSDHKAFEQLPKRIPVHNRAEA